MRLYFLCVLFVAACGAKTGLRIDPSSLDGGMDARVLDAGRDASRDIGVDFGMCIPFRAEARLAALDIFIMLDSSGSMEDTTAAGTTKMEAITEAFSGFVSSPDSAGIGVGLSFFPIENTRAPETCMNDAQCGEPGACLRPDICYPSNEQYCRTNRDCTIAGDTCMPLGRCDQEGDQFCFTDGTIGCPRGIRCLDYGICENRTVCDDAMYSMPSVDVAQLPAVGPRIISAMRDRMLVGGTPTAPALRGALDRARAWRRDNAASKVIVILATDGFPTSCDDSIEIWGEQDSGQGIATISDAASRGVADGIQTFVIGVFAPEEEVDARANLSAIARAGGTTEALVVSTADPVSQRLLAILNELRRSVRTCAYAIPHAGVIPDPNDLSVRIIAPNGAVTPLTRREGPQQCDGIRGGFFFEQTMPGTRPGYIELCPASCVIAATPGHRIEMQGGCGDQ